MLKPRTADEAKGRWASILPVLGIDAKHLTNRHGPCPICGGRDRFRFDDKNGRGTWFCSQCGSGDGFSLLKHLHGWTFNRAAMEVDAILGTVPPAKLIKGERTDDSKVRTLRRIWEQSQAVTRGDPVWLYLNRRTGIEEVPPDLRFHPALRYIDGGGKDLGTFPAMLAMLRYPDGKGASIHRTYLTATGAKAAVPEAKKMMPGKPLNTAAVRLSVAGRCVGVAEGIETALSASFRFGMPIWAATTATLLEQWVPPAGVEQVLIAGDNDESFTGQDAAYSLARRLRKEGYAVRVEIPAQAGTDWADEVAA